MYISCAFFTHHTTSHCYLPLTVISSDMYPCARQIHSHYHVRINISVHSLIHCLNVIVIALCQSSVNQCNRIVNRNSPTSNRCMCNVSEHSILCVRKWSQFFVTHPRGQQAVSPSVITPQTLYPTGLVFVVDILQYLSTRGLDGVMSRYGQNATLVLYNVIMISRPQLTMPIVELDGEICTE